MNGAAFELRLYVAGDAPNSLQARANLAQLCSVYLEGRHRVEVVDVLHEPERALSDGVFLTPTLVKVSPAPAQRIVGSLSDLPPLLHALGLTGV